MQIIKHELLSKTELLRRLKETRLRGFDKFPVYQNATLEVLEQVDTELLVPPQKYVLVEGVKTILDLARKFAERGVDIFSLQGALLFWLEGSDPDNDPPIPFLPPVVEESWEKDERMVPLINDGMHRVYTARKLGRKINIVLVRNVPKEYPYYAYALADGWSQVEEIPELTDGYKKKEYRNPDNYKALFRDFNAVFEGVQKDRKKTNPIEIKA
ncbi:MAG: hypothetical protein WC657_00965 [Candidatus Paceibacterota bacterium]|jgi:hypothetical protein